MLRGNKRLTGKSHLTRWGIVALAVVVALGSIGITYAAWSGQGKGKGNVVKVVGDPFTWAVSNDNGAEEIGGIYPIIDPGDDGKDPADRQAPATPLDPNAKYDKNVASTTVSFDAVVDPYNIDVTIDNAYPYYHPTVFFGLENCEKTPGQIVSIEIDENFHPNQDDTDADEIDALTVTVGGIKVNDWIDPGQEVIGDVAIKVEQKAEQNHTYTIRVKIRIVGEAECETAYAYGGAKAKCFSEYGFSNWGWTNGPLEPGDYTFDIHAGAGGCEPTNGTLVGELTVEYDELTSTWTVTYTLSEGTMTSTHLYVGNEDLPVNKKGLPTVSPGQYPYQHTHDLDDDATTYTYTVYDVSGPIYVIAHAVVCP